MTRVLAVSASREVMGTEHSLFNVSDHLSARGVDMMLAAEPGGALEKGWLDRGLRFLPLTVPSRQGFRPNTGKGYHGIPLLASLPGKTITSIVRITKLVKHSRAQVVHSNSLMTHVDCAIAGRLARVATVLELHDIVAPGIGRFVMGVAVRIAGNAIAVSEAVRDQLPPWARRNVVVIAQGVDVEKFSDSSATAGPPRRLGGLSGVPTIAAVGRVDPEKGLHVLISAVAELRASGQNAQLVLVGSPNKDDGSYQAHLVALGERVLGDALTMVPQVDDVPAALRAVDVLACPSVEEPFGQILLEAQACGVPVIATSAGGPLEFIVDGVTGLLVAPNDSHDLAVGLGRLLGDETLRRKIARAGQDRVRSRYTAAVRADGFARLYRDMTGG
ncbi:glycosyltransferase family 4 protein [Mycobacterium yunnanensis]|uniref:Glycosyltransferase family 4 protein n=1 Tax=Mycobacterium yunnanensis TaxID=368477 RepID=A0A9X2YK16_9MYCO|nr:glycosyltransferase family 4 protein [Mycobacterium yunnanensis]MCV7420823.1 glycosyltransferase family 4 protein [Mycobacterium yunnanensis]